jgi:hypothetical protein
MHTRASPALVHWRSASRHEIRHLLDAHHIVRRIGPGGQPAAEQILHALVVQLAARFQRYSRDLHDAAIDALVTTAPESHRTVILSNLTAGRRLDRQNPTSAVLAQDFRRFDIELWPALAGEPPGARDTLDQVMAARNAIAHQDVPGLERLRLDLTVFRGWRQALDDLAGRLDVTFGRRIGAMVGSFPWNQR